MNGWILVLAIYASGESRTPSFMHSVHEIKTKAQCERNAALIVGEFVRDEKKGASTMRHKCVPAYEGDANVRP